MLGVEGWLHGMPPTLIYLLIGVIVLLESMGIPLPGEIALVSASLLAASGLANIWAVATSAAVAAIIGDSIGYAIGRRGGRNLLIRFGRRFPRHFGPAQLAKAEQTFARWGVWAVFFGRFVALLRILAGPLAGALNVPYRKFLLANASGGIVWAFGTSFVIYHLGRAAERYLRGFSWVALVVGVAFGVFTTLYLRHRAARAEVLEDDGDPATNPTALDQIAAIVVEAAQDGAAQAATTVAGTASADRRPRSLTKPSQRRRNGARSVRQPRNAR
ncbi:MAG TPA: DedA family protein [Micromonosporaceae bacterium]